MEVAEFLKWIWGQLSYIVAVISGAALVAARMPRRYNFSLRVISSLAVLTATKMLLDHFFIAEQMYNMWTLVNLTFSMLLYLMTAVTVVICFDCDIYAGLFCATIGYSLQHIAHRLYLLYRFTVSEQSILLDIGVISVLTIVVYFVVYRWILKNYRYCNVIVDNKMQILISTIFIMVTIFLDQLILNAFTDLVYRVMVIVMSIAACVMGILLELGNMSSKNIELERDIVTRLQTEEMEKLRYDKSIIDMLNIKVHDIKHQLALAEGMMHPEAVQMLKDAIISYETTVQTGNSALDAILTRKYRLAEEKGIKISCQIDGEKLSFLSDIDVYSLFGNILDNAIEAVEKIEDPEKRSISLRMTVKDYFVCIRAQNHFEGSLDVSNGLPQSTKEDRMFHGFGLKSIRMLAQKYHGDLRIVTEDDNFILDILFCLGQA